MPKPVMVGEDAPVTVPVTVGLVIVPAATLSPLTAVAVRVPPLTEPPLSVPPEIVAELNVVLVTVAPLRVPEQAKLPLALVTVQPVEAEPPPRRMSPVLVAPILMALVPLASIVKLAATEALTALPETLRLFTALELSDPPEIVAVLIVEPVVTAPVLVTLKIEALPTCRLMKSPV